MLSIYTSTSTPWRNGQPLPCINVDVDESSGLLRQPTRLHDSVTRKDKHIAESSTCTSLYLSVSTHGVIGQFCRLYFTTYSPLNLKVSFPTRPINLRDIINMLLTLFSQSMLKVLDPRLSPLIYRRCYSCLGHKSTGKIWSATYSTDLELSY